MVKETYQLAPNIDLDISKSNKKGENKEDYKYIMHMQRQKFESFLKPMNLIQGLIWDDIIYAGILKKFPSIRRQWKQQDKTFKDDFEQKFAIKFGTKEELLKFDEELKSTQISKELFGGAISVISKGIRRFDKKIRKNITKVRAKEDIGTWINFTSQLAIMGIFLVTSVEKDD